MPNLLDHSLKKETGENYANVAIGALLGTSDAQGKIIDISNSFPIQLRIQAVSEESSKEPTYIFDIEYIKKMLKFHKQVNDLESFLGVYISTTQIDKQGMIIAKYFMDMFEQKSFFRSPLKMPIFLLFDPTLQNNKLDVKVLSIHSFFLKDSPLFSEMPFKFNLANLPATGLDVLLYNQEYYDTISILQNNNLQDITQDTIGALVDSQKVLSNRNLMLQNLSKLIDNLQDCEDYIQDVLNKKEVADPEIGRLINKCLGQFNGADLALLEQMVNTNLS